MPSNELISQNIIIKMLIKTFESFFEKLEDLLTTDPVTTRLILKYIHKKKEIHVLIKSDKRVRMA